MNEQSPDFPIPESAQKAIDADSREFGGGFDRADDIGDKTHEQIRQGLLEQGIGLTTLSAEEIEARELEALEMERKDAERLRKEDLIRANKPVKPYHTRGYDLKGGGPPQHIADDVRRAQGLDNS